ncbi:DUF4352 domain-containing protein [Prauserella flavalba]|uniref:DUF4352 domain-containing protein n=1 Tax=Prauserella flavalba TaxID=1477506 RepID=A0A318LRU1_9PSEU|nr:DUF4352 domain-containing protein [Prauserella flavalba]PXY33972.1 hypothetical protein BA062_17305 [Prauserella flavalba]
MPRPVLAGLVLLAVTSCAAPAAGHSAATNTSEAVTAERRAATAADRDAVLVFGADHRFESGLVVTVTGPKIFRPSESAYPRAGRAAAFGVVVYNETEQPYRLSSLSVSATTADQQAKQVVDPTQGYNGIVDADRDIPPGEIVRLQLAFVVPDRSTPVRLVVRPDVSTPATAVYGGSV